MFLKSVIVFLLLVGFVGCGTVEQEDNVVKTQTQNSERTNGDEVNTATEKTGKQLYNACEGCHGLQGEKEALGKSQLIGGQSSAVTKYQLEEYKSGRLDQYGMGQLMKGQSQLTSNEIALLSKYIETLSITNTISTTTSTPTVPEKDIYAVCKGCHGANGEISAMKESRIIRDMNTLEIYNALLGYQNGTYGGKMKALMKGQVNGLSKTDLKDLARYINDL